MSVVQLKTLPRCWLHGGQMKKGAPRTTRLLHDLQSQKLYETALHRMTQCAAAAEETIARASFLRPRNLLVLREHSTTWRRACAVGRRPATAAGPAALAAVS